jgi:hypothetical protein
MEKTLPILGAWIVGGEGGEREEHGVRERRHGWKKKIEIRGCRRWSCHVTGDRPLARRCCSWSAVGGGRGKMEMEGEIWGDFRSK